VPKPVSSAFDAIGPAAAAPASVPAGALFARAIRDLDSGAVETARQALLAALEEALAAGDEGAAARARSAIELCSFLAELDRDTLEMQEAHRIALARRGAERVAAVSSVRSLLAPDAPPRTRMSAVAPAIALSGLVIPFALGVVDVPLPPRLRRAPVALRIRLLGGFEVEVAGVPLGRWRSNRARLLFAYLALHRREAVSRQQLMGLFWPEHSEERAENNLSLTVMAARRALEEAAPEAGELISVHRGAYALGGADVWLDCEAFTAAAGRAAALESGGLRVDAGEALDEAIALYNGDLLPGDLYEEWTLEARGRLQDVFTDVLLRRARLAGQAGDFELCIRLNRRILERDPAAEEAHREVITAYLELGQRSRALRQAVACREALARHLGVAPDERTLAVFRRALLSS
jgi:DNA-binding SARP family transcriptional activator